MSRLPPHLALAREAMATRFEIVLPGKDRSFLRAAGEAALDEIERLDKQLNVYNPAGEISYLNARAAYEAVRVEPGLFRLLETSQRLHRESAGAFDITIGPLLRCWGFMGGKRRIPTPAELKEAIRTVGMHFIHLDPKRRKVRFAKPGVMLDLGAIGKGYAVDRAIELLRQSGVSCALLHGGTSTVYALGRPLDGPWRVALEYPARKPAASPRVLSVVTLEDEALSVSAVWGKSFRARGKTYGHIIDPRTGWPASKAALSAVILPSATETDALSTALLTEGLKGHETLCRARPGMRAFVMAAPRRGGRLRFKSAGIYFEGG